MTSFLDLPNEILLEVVAQGQFSFFRLCALRRVNRRFATLLAPRALENIAVSLSRPGPPGDRINTEDVLELSKSPSFAHFRRCVRRIRIVANKRYRPVEFSSAPFAIFDTLFLSMPNLTDVRVVLNADCFELGQIRPVFVDLRALSLIMEKVVSSKRLRLHVDIFSVCRDTYGWEDGEGADMFLRFIQSIPSEISSLNLDSDRRAILGPASAVLERCLNLTSFNVQGFLLKPDSFLTSLCLSEERLKRVTCLDIRGSESDFTPFAGVRSEATLKLLPNLEEFSVSGCLGSTDTAWNYFKGRAVKPLHVVRTSDPGGALYDYLASPAAARLRVLELDMGAITGLGDTLNRGGRFRDPSHNDKLASQFWSSAVPRLSECLTTLGVSETRTNGPWFQTGIEGLVRNGHSWSPTQYSKLQLPPNLESFGCLLVYNCPGRFDHLMRVLAPRCRHLKKLKVYVAWVDLPDLHHIRFPYFTKRWSRKDDDYLSEEKMTTPTQKDFDKLFEEVESSEEWKEGLPLDLELTIEVSALLAEELEEIDDFVYHCDSKEFVLLEEGWCRRDMAANRI